MSLRTLPRTTGPSPAAAPADAGQFEADLADRWPACRLADLSVLLLGRHQRRQQALHQAVATTGVQLTATAASEGIRRLVRHPPDLLLLHLGGDHRADLGLLERIRAVSAVGVMTLGPADDRQHGIQALEAGADDHLAYPFDRAEFAARLRALRRRTGPAPSPLLVSTATSSLVIDPARRLVTRDGERLHLTDTERRLLELLVANAGRLLDHRALLQHVWGEAYETETNYLRVYMAQLRKKLGDCARAPELIETEPGIGYRWIARVTPQPGPAAALVDV